MSLGISFRFLKLNKMQAMTLTREISGAISIQEEACDYLTGIVPLEENNFDDINLFFIRQKIDINDCDVLIRSSAFKGNAELGVPLKVNRFLKDIDCKLTLTCEE